MFKVVVIYRSLLFLAAVFSDVRHMKVPLWLSELFIVSVFYDLTVMNKHDFLFNVICMMMVAVTCFIGMKYFSFGGADVIWAAALAFMYGQKGIAALMAAFVLSLPSAYLKSKRGTEYPFIPYLFVGYMLTCFIR